MRLVIKYTRVIAITLGIEAVLAVISYLITKDQISIGLPFLFCKVFYLSDVSELHHSFSIKYLLVDLILYYLPISVIANYIVQHFWKARKNSQASAGASK